VVLVDRTALRARYLAALPIQVPLSERFGLAVGVA
jgi:hypothetical protein